MKTMAFYEKAMGGYYISTEYTDARLFFGNTLSEAAKNFEKFYGITQHKDVKYINMAKLH